ncbi:AraC family transcriptional regulator [uncultured Tenacibaculum sp.]|uniref:helix-turn-helix domain-containing protein n=1 Tax=uncultured Tenacibaculum sp. TaxID=174713 RepID=UPI0026016FAD|nr:helix-turn-helix transcriptional regulator [uncultured Tenacibaculum sp.]
MKTKQIHINSIPQFLKTLNLNRVCNPLVTIINSNEIDNIKFASENNNYTFDFFTISLKDNASSYFFGKHDFNFNKGKLAFTKPNQTLSVSNTEELNDHKGWILAFHNDLLKNSPLQEKISNYRFFSYDINEGLDLSEKEQDSITDCINFIKNEISKESDNHTNIVISSVLEVLLNLCNRIYERQFKEKALQNNHVISKVDAFLKFYYDNNLFAEKGIPSVQQIANYVKLSPNYLSITLKKESGKNTKDYINYFILEKSKSLLIHKQEYSINELSYKLGFNYPHYFSRFFKSKIGKTPHQYRKEKSL